MVSLRDPRRKFEVAFVTDEIEGIEAQFGLERLALGLTKLEAGPFRGEYRALELPGLRVLRLTLDRNLQIRGCLPQNTNGIVIPIKAQAGFRCDGGRVEEDHLLLLPAAENFDVTTGGAIDLILMLVEERPNALHSMVFDRPTAPSIFVRGEAAPLRHDALADLKVAAVEAIPRGRSSKRSGLARALGQRALAEELIRRLVAALESGDGARRGFAVSARERRACCARRARDYLEANLRRPVSLEELEKVSNASRRTLHYAFRAHFGLPPIAFHKCRRLKGVREELKRALPADASVTEIGLEWGFWHLGRFAGEYKAMFGETPKATLRRHEGLATTAPAEAAKLDGRAEAA